MSTAERNAQVERYLPLVKQVARQVRYRSLRRADLDDLVQDGVIGLILAIEHFDPTRSFASAAEREKCFAAYARIKIRGAMLDAARVLSHSRSFANVKLCSLDEPPFCGAASETLTWEDVLPAQASVEDEVLPRVLAGEVLDAARRCLDPKQRAIFLRRSSGEYLESIGASLGLVTASVRRRYMRAVNTVQGCIA